MKLFFCIILLFTVFSVYAEKAEQDDIVFSDSTLVTRDSILDTVQISSEIEQLPDPEFKRLQHVRREFRYREQVWLGVAMMAFMAFIMTTAQTWNPR